jgi:thymidine kinase
MLNLTAIPQKPVGRIELIIGPMFSGKTTELINRIERCQRQRLSCLLITHVKSAPFSSHDGISHPGAVCDRLRSNFPHCLTYDVIGIDESQFFDDIVIFAQIMANSGKLVIIAGRDGTFERRPFGHTLGLVSCCESITKLSAVCTETGQDAPFTRRIVESALINGSEICRPASRAVYFGIGDVGSVHLVIGPVNSGKTTELMRLLKRYQFGHGRVVSFRKERLGGSVPVDVVDKLPEVESLAEFDVIGVDDGEKYPGIADWADALANQGKSVMVAALDGDEQQEACPEVGELIARAETLRKLESVCPLTGLPAPITAMVGATVMPISRFALVSGLAAQGLVGGNC